MIEQELRDLLQAPQLFSIKDAPRLAPEQIRRSANRRIRRRRALAGSMTTVALVAVVSGVSDLPRAGARGVHVGAAASVQKARAVVATARSVAGLDWRNMAFPVSCGRGKGLIRFSNGIASVNGFRATLHLSTVLLADDTASTKPPVPAEVVWVSCVGADVAPDSVLVYTVNSLGPVLRGTAVAYAAHTNVESVTDSLSTLRIVALGYSSPQVPRFAPDLTVITSVQLSGAGLRIDRRTQKS